MKRSENFWLGIGVAILIAYTLLVLSFGKDDKLYEQAARECIVHPGQVVFIPDMDEYICQH